MDNVIDIIKSTFLFKEDVDTDNLVFKICGRISVGICVSFALLVAATQGKLSLHQETKKKRSTVPIIEDYLYNHLCMK